MTKDEALKLALEAVHTLTEYQRGYENGFIDGMQKQAQSSVDKAVNAMSQRTEQDWDALAEKQLASIKRDMKISLEDAAVRATHKVMTEFEIQPTQRTWAGLTRDEQSFVYSNLHNATSRKDSFWVDFANAIEAKLKEKNT
jgi:hypothetical protein